jgi:hypothetical protein
VAQSDANDKVNEFADDDKTTGADGNPRFAPVFSTKASELVNDDNAP